MPEAADGFISIFEERRKQIAGFDGCNGVKLMRDIKNPNQFFTYSIWKDKEALDKYRSSDFFQATWEEVKKIFIDRPEAWSVMEVNPSNQE